MMDVINDTAAKVPVLVDDNGTQYDTQMIAGARWNLSDRRKISRLVAVGSKEIL